MLRYVSTLYVGVQYTRDYEPMPSEPSFLLNGIYFDVNFKEEEEEEG